MLKTIVDLVEPVLLSLIVGLLGFIAKKAAALPKVSQGSVDSGFTGPPWNC